MSHAASPYRPDPELAALYRAAVRRANLAELLRTLRWLALGIAAILAGLALAWYQVYR